MKVRLHLITIDTDKIEKLISKKKKYYNEVKRKADKSNYSIEMKDHNYIFINKQEYKLLKKILEGGNDE